MDDLNFKGRWITVVFADDLTTDQRMIEFTDPALPGPGCHVVVLIPDGGSWLDATVSIDPLISEVPVDFLLWAIEKARAVVER
ncbi:hypothetical protein [Nocardia camponoti]|nr:hypothetical protein [Nocardia camponoti]